MPGRRRSAGRSTPARSRRDFRLAHLPTNRLVLGDIGWTGRDGMALRTLRCLVDALAEDAEGEAIIAHHADTPTVWTRRQLHDEIERFARDLIAAGIGAGEPVALIASSRPEWAVAALAIARSGAIAMPISEQLGAPELERIVGHSRMSARDHDRRSPEDPGQGRRCWRAGGRAARRRRGGRPARPFGAGLARAARRQRRAAGARARSAGASGLHFRHHGDAQGRAADPCQSVRQSRRAGGRAPRAAGRSGAPAAAPAARLSADRGPAGAARLGCGGGPAGRHHRAADQRGAAGVCLHHHDRRAAAVRGHARRHRAQDGRASDRSRSAATGACWPSPPGCCAASAGGRGGCCSGRCIARSVPPSACSRRAARRSSPRPQRSSTGWAGRSWWATG